MVRNIIRQKGCWVHEIKTVDHVYFVPYDEVEDINTVEDVKNAYDDGTIEDYVDWGTEDYEERNDVRLDSIQEGDSITYSKAWIW